MASTSLLNTIPTYSTELIEALDTMYPNRCADPKETDREIWIRVGQRQVVDMLLMRLDKADLKGLANSSSQLGNNNDNNNNIQTIRI